MWYDCIWSSVNNWEHINSSAAWSRIWRCLTRSVHSQYLWDSGFVPHDSFTFFGSNMHQKQVCVPSCWHTADHVFPYRTIHVSTLNIPLGSVSFWGTLHLCHLSSSGPLTLTNCMLCSGQDWWRGKENSAPVPLFSASLTPLDFFLLPFDPFDCFLATERRGLTHVSRLIHSDKWVGAFTEQTSLTSLSELLPDHWRHYVSTKRMLLTPSFALLPDHGRVKISRRRRPPTISPLFISWRPKTFKGLHTRNRSYHALNEVLY